MSALGRVGLRGIVKRFGAFTALDGIDLEIEPAEFFALLGELLTALGLAAITVVAATAFALFLLLGSSHVERNRIGLPVDPCIGSAAAMRAFQLFDECSHRLVLRTGLDTYRQSNSSIESRLRTPCSRGAPRPCPTDRAVPRQFHSSPSRAPPS